MNCQKKTKSVGLKSCSRMKPKQENVINHENNKNNVWENINM